MMILVRRYEKEEKIFFIWSSGFSDVQVIPKLNIKIKVTHQAPAVQKVDSAIHLACVQTSPIPQEKSGEETSVNRRR